MASKSAAKTMRPVKGKRGLASMAILLAQTPVSAAILMMSAPKVAKPREYVSMVSVCARLEHLITSALAQRVAKMTYASS
jgi:hypothetical protein